ncbi:MAG: YybS family protein [Ectobacillus sp.]
MKNTRLITEGAVLLAVFIILLLATLYIPVLNIVLPLTLPLPFIIFSMRYDLKHTWLLLAAASLITIIVSSPFNVATAIMFGTTGIVLGSMYKKQKGPVELLLVGTLTYMLNMVVLYIISVRFFEYNFIQEFQTVFGQSIKQAEQFIKATGAQVNEKQLQQLKEFPKLLGYIIPSVFVLGAAMMSWLTLLLAAPILRRLRFVIKPWPFFYEIQLPRSILLYYAAFLLIVTFSRPEAGSYLYIALLNLNLIFPLLMAIQGFSFIAFFSHSKGYSKAIPIMLFIVSFFMPILFSLVSFLGIIDLGFSLRRKLKPHK